MKKRFDVEILGQELSVVSDSGDAHVADVIGYVSDKVSEAGVAVGNKNALKIAILAALNIADEYLRLKAVKQDAYSQLENRSERLVRLINDIR
ncbi:MAG: cell division protein ZapA [Deltaproteobacteria bacterium]|nr:cell division protein ZapA [Deltaproteobacteria bacterium]